MNNNYAPYQNAYASSASSTSGGGPNGSSGNASGSSGINSNNNGNSNGMGGSGGGGEKKMLGIVSGQMTPQITAKVMFGTVGAIKELREKEQAEKNGSIGGGVAGARRY